MPDLYLGIRLPEACAAQYPPDEQRGAPHVTLCFSPECTAPFADVLEVVEAVARAAKPVPIRLGSTVEYLGDTEQRAAVLLVDDPGPVATLRDWLRAALAARGIPTPETHPEFIAHSTVAYVGAGEYSGPLPSGGCTAMALEVALGDARAVLELGRGRENLAARVPYRELRWGVDLEAEAGRRTHGIELTDGWVLGKPFRCLATGEIYQRVAATVMAGAKRRHIPGGERRGTITREDLAAIVAAFDAGQEIPINLEHRPPSAGTVVAAWLVDGGESLAVAPAYNPGLAEYVAASSGAIWSSPEIAPGPSFHPATRQLLGSILMDGLALTRNPAQAHEKLDRVRLSDPRADHPTTDGSEEGPDMEEIQQLKDMMAAGFAALGDQLEACLAAMKPAGEEPAGEEPAGEEMPGGSPMASLSQGTADGANLSQGKIEQVIQHALAAATIEHKTQLAALQARLDLADGERGFAELLASRTVSPTDRTRYLADHRRAHSPNATDEDRELFAEWGKREALVPAERTSHGLSQGTVDPLSPAAIHQLATEKFGGDFAKAAAAAYRSSRGR